MELPSGTVTFLFTDIEGSTRLLHSLGERYVDGLAQHSEIIEGAVEGNHGIVVNTEGDAYFCVFREAPDAAAAAVSILLGLSTHDWPPDSEFRVRIGFHTGEGVLGAADYVGMDVHRAARISAAGHGGQALLSADSHALVEEHLPDGVTVTDLGSHNLKDLPEPEHIFQLVIPGMESAFPTLRTGATPPLPLPPLVAPTPAARAAPAVSAAASRGLVRSLSKGRLAALALAGGVAAGIGLGGVLFGGDAGCEVYADPESQGGVKPAVTSTLSPDVTPAPGVTEPAASATTTTTIQRDSDASGTWVFTVSVTAVTGSVCQGEIGDVYEREVTISGTDDALVIVGLDDLTDPGDPAWTGTFSGSSLKFGGTRAEDDGLTTARFEMTLSEDGTLLDGFETWTWDWTSQGETGTCTEGASTVTATRAP